MSRTRTLLAVTVTVLAAPALGGCFGDDPGPAPPPSPSVSSSEVATPSATEAVPRRPTHVVRAWIDARNFALASGDLDSVRALTDQSCMSCSGLIDPIEDVYSKGGHFETKGWSVASLRLKSKTAREATVVTGLEFSSGRTVSEEGADPVVYDAERHIVEFRLANGSDGWRITLIGFMS